MQMNTRNSSQEQSSPSLYEQIGGIKTINRAVDYFYSRVGQSRRLYYFFKPLDIRAQSAHQKAFIAHILGGFPNFVPASSFDTTAPFEDMQLEERDVQEINEIIKESMEFAGVDRSIIDQLMTLLHATKDEVISQKYGLF